MAGFAFADLRLFSGAGCGGFAAEGGGVGGWFFGVDFAISWLGGVGLAFALYLDCVFGTR